MQHKYMIIFFAIFFNLTSISFAADNEDFDGIVKLFVNYRIVKVKGQKEIIKQFILNTKTTSERCKYLKIMAIEIGEKQLLKLGSFYCLPEEIRIRIGYFKNELNKIEEAKFKEDYRKLEIGHFVKDTSADFPWNIRKELPQGIELPLGVEALPDIESIDKLGYFIRYPNGLGSDTVNVKLWAPFENPNLTLTAEESRDINFLTHLMRSNGYKIVQFHYGTIERFTNVNDYGPLHSYEEFSKFKNKVGVFLCYAEKTYAIFIGRIKDSYDGKRLVENIDEWKNISSIMKKS